MSPGTLEEIAKSVLGALRIGPTVHDFRNRIGYLLDAKTRSRNARFRARVATDGLPLPPPKLIYLVTGQFDAEAFYNSGILGAACIHEILNRHGVDTKTFGKALDFGCGCGRVIRHWRGLTGTKLFGLDYNLELIDWCQRNLQFAEFALNRAGVPLMFPDAHFDFVYSISVFTHLTQPDQRFWMDEIMRVLRPGGHILFTVHGLSRLSDLSSKEREIFEAGMPVVLGSQYSGTNSCGTYHPEKYVRQVLCRNWRFVAFEAGAAKDANQDVFLMQKLP